MKTRDLEKVLSDKRDNVLNIIRDLKEVDFKDYLSKLIEDKGFINSEIITKTNIERTYFYQILSGLRNPGRDKVIEIALVLKLDREEIDRLLKLSNHSILYPKVKRDALIIYAINNDFDLYKTNELLLENELEILK